MVWQGNYTSLFIGGEWVEPATDDTIGVVSPFTEQALAGFPPVRGRTSTARYVLRVRLSTTARGRA